jgi:hypothetical protein
MKLRSNHEGYIITLITIDLKEEAIHSPEHRHSTMTLKTLFSGWFMAQAHADV